MLKETQQVSPDAEASATEGQNQRLALLEAALYVAGRPLDLRTLGSMIRTRSKKLVQHLARRLKLEYESRNMSLEILELEDERFVMQLRREYSPKVQRLAMRPLLTSGPLKTLSYIAYRQPVPQRQVITVRGNHVYAHLKQLEELGLISRQRTGRTKILRTTHFFADYFGFSHDPRALKRQIKKVFAFTEPAADSTKE
ncbi:MAG: SMC-Scp complex subunit ScpB [Candidatus Bathyarchaeota archaeon]|nr:SMC-Scp complex subunit ScpB [Candidatus Bathyarchaeota archaeon]